MRLLTLAADPHHRPCGVAAVIALCVLLSSPRAEAQSATDRAATAQGLYESAAALIKAGNFVAACPKLEESQRLDPTVSTQFFLATCYENTGRPTSAWSLFLDVVSAAQASGSAVRESTARARVAALEPKLPRLSVAVAEANARLPGLTVRRDGVELKPVAWGTLIPVDLGEHTVRVTATGKAPWGATVTVRELGERVEVKVPPLDDGAAHPAPGDTLTTSQPPTLPVPSTLTVSNATPPGPAGLVTSHPPRPLTPPGPAGQRVAGVVVGSLGIAGLLAGGALGLTARSVWTQAASECPAQTACSAAAHDQSVHSLSLATGSTAAFVAGGAAVAGGIVLWLTTPSHEPAAQINIVAAGAVGAFASGSF